MFSWNKTENFSLERSIDVLFAVENKGRESKTGLSILCWVACAPSKECLSPSALPPNPPTPRLLLLPERRLLFSSSVIAHLYSCIYNIFNYLGWSGFVCFWNRDLVWEEIFLLVFNCSDNVNCAQNISWNWRADLEWACCVSGGLLLQKRYPLKYKLPESQDLRMFCSLPYTLEKAKRSSNVCWENEWANVLIWKSHVLLSQPPPLLTTAPGLWFAVTAEETWHRRDQDLQAQCVEGWSCAVLVSPHLEVQCTFSQNRQLGWKESFESSRTKLK